MVRRLNAIDATAGEIDQATRTVKYSRPVSDCAGIPFHVLPL